jgi:hypothetical protein
MNLEEHLLNHIFDITSATQQALHQTSDVTAVMPEQFTEGRFFARLTAPNQFVQLDHDRYITLTRPGALH